jgi:hypothetical protein
VWLWLRKRNLRVEAWKEGMEEGDKEKGEEKREPSVIMFA